MAPEIKAISICVYDPTGRQTLETYPPDSTWFWKDGSKARKRRKDAGMVRPPRTGVNQVLSSVAITTT